MNITVKNVPEAVYRTIKQEAEQQGRSLNTQIIQVLQTEATEVQRRRNFRKARNELEKFAASLGPLEDSAPLIREDRER